MDGHRPVRHPAIRQRPRARRRAAYLPVAARSDPARRGALDEPGDIVLSPFAGIGSEGYVTLQMGRRFVGAELKASYYQQAARNLAMAMRGTADMFWQRNACQQVIR